ALAPTVLFRVTYASAALAGTRDVTRTDVRPLTTGSLPTPPQVVHSGSDTDATLPANTLAPGPYQVTALVQFPGVNSIGA
ncbi:hypothetical protein, partial [Streptomyces sp. GbtcB6]|uniref:hypothetical protein n=1 Tax=Streptomyces sp. GbtcB6 TaxID=2824751 RepID=UPI001C2F1B58